MKRLLMAGLFVLFGCAGKTQMLRSGILAGGYTQSAFIRVWGRPDRIHTGEFREKTIEAGSDKGAVYLKRSRLYEIWSYKTKKTELYFHRRRLVLWESEATPDDLAE